MKMLTSCQWKENLPRVRGVFSFNEPLALRTWFNVGGPADLVFTPADADDLQTFLSGLEIEIPTMVIGAASNLLVRDGGVRGVVIVLGKAFEQISISGTEILAGAAAPDVKVASSAARAELTGLEFLRGVPGTVGGAVAMNAGAFGGQVSDVLIRATIVTRDGGVQTKSGSELNFEYRTSSIGANDVVVDATFMAAKGNGREIRDRMQEIARERADAQPVDTRTGGSTFKNPASEEARGRSAWQLIDEAGCRGLRLGGAKVSDKHCNFIENTAHASATEIENLIEEVRTRVADKTGVSLEWEIKCIGERPDDA